MSKITAIGAVAVAAVQGRWDDLKHDWDNKTLNPFNQDASKALDSKVLSFYKGSTVVRQDVVGTCSALGTIWAESLDVDGTDIQHEFGHSVQERLLGLSYWILVALPSAYYCEFGDYLLESDVNKRKKCITPRCGREQLIGLEV